MLIVLGLAITYWYAALGVALVGAAVYVWAHQTGRLPSAPQTPEAVAVAQLADPAAPTQTCPDCAETVLAAARRCRYCGHTFE